MNRLRARKSYPEALEVYRVYCNTMSCTDKQDETREAIRQEYFESAYDQFETALKFDNLPEIGRSLSILRTHADVDQGVYRKAEQQFLEYELQKEVAAVQRELNQENYRTVIAMGKRLKTSYGYDRPEINRLIEEAETEIFRDRVNSERKAKRMQMAVVLGLETRSNARDDLTNFPDGYTHYTVAYSFGLYKKFNYFKTHRGAYPKGSDLIGFKARLFDHQTYDVLPWEDANDASITTPDRFSVELLLDGTAFYGFHYGGGVVFQDLGSTDQYQFCAELGLRIPIGPVALQGNVRSDWIEEVPVYSLTAGVLIEIDFWRKFGKKDRDAIKAQLGF